MRVLFAASELFPLIKTGGLGDVAHSLPNALAALGHEVRVVLPAYRAVLKKLDSLRLAGHLRLGDGREARVLEANDPHVACPIWLVDLPALFDRPGPPYSDRDGVDWPDNAARFRAFSEAAAMLASDGLGLDWHADVAHANDWQTGLVPAFLAQRPRRPRTVFTIHNIAYDCLLDYAGFSALAVPQHWWAVERGEFYDRFSLLKCGLTFSDMVTTVSPRYAEEIRQPDYGYGYASILASLGDRLVGILNGIDDVTWNPDTDRFLVRNYAAGGKVRAAKRANRDALLEALGGALGGAPGDGPADRPVIGSVGRLVHQKGSDLLLDALPRLIDETDAVFAIVGAGDPHFEHRLSTLADSYAGRVFHHIGYSERLAHLVEAGSDMFVMPSRYEPCGLNQMYSLRYGTPPIVRETGGLADTVVDASPRSLARGEANGFVFDDASADALCATVRRALELFRQPKQWMKLVRSGMRSDFGWRQSAQRYLELYQ
jgi:starch synthase